MFLERKWSCLALTGVLLAACSSRSGSPLDAGLDASDAGSSGRDVGRPASDAGSSGRDAGQAADGSVSTPPEDGPFAPSNKASVRFKRHERLRNDLARALDLAPSEVCRELGQFDCTQVVHKVTLGGVSAYALGIFEPVEDTTLTAPLAVERTVLAACTRRVDIDSTRPPGQRIFDRIVLDNDRIADINDPEVATAVDALYKRALLRPARTTEVEHLRQLYRDIEADGEPRPGRDWAVLACFSIFSSVEALFY
ncbi:MAG: hypothetical protein AAFN74_07580 [Myxococcota bacterium]